ncbi:hypothetical protein Tco_0674442 [Tanacetum coccineum]
MQAQEQEELSIEEKATLFQQILEKRRKHFAAKRVEDKESKPPTKAQQRKIMNSYSCDEIVLDVFYNGCFMIYPLKYAGEALALKLSKVNKLSYKQMCDLLLEKVKDDIWHWYYCKPGCCLEEGLTIVENDMDVKKMYEMANLHGLLEVYVSHIPQLLVLDYYLKNLCVDESDDEVTSQV